MEIYLRNTASGLIPLYDEDYEEKCKLKIGEDYKAKITKARNLGLHRKYFALINCTWEYMTEDQCEFFKNNKESFRKTIEMAAGYFEKIYSIQRKEWIEQPISIAFDKMDEFQFRDLYENCRGVIFATFLRHVSQKDFNKNLINF
jgi:hypothetical protein